MEGLEILDSIENGAPHELKVAEKIIPSCCGDTGPNMAHRRIDRPSGGWVNTLRQYLLVSLMVGMDASVALEVILMVANAQTLGVPLRYAALPVTFTGIFSVLLIPITGILMDRQTRSKSANAKILVFTSALQILGNICIFMGNLIKLLYFDGVSDDQSDLPAAVPNVTQAPRNISLSDDLYKVTLLTSTVNIKNSPVTLGYDTETSFSVNSFPVTNIITAIPDSVEENIQYYAIMAMIGYGLIDTGYDSTNCFLKTFAVASTAPEVHASIIVKSVVISSVGGCFTAVLGSIRLGEFLTAGTGHDSNAAQCALLAALCLVVLLTGLVTTLATGFRCPPDSGQLEESVCVSDTGSFTPDDKSLLVGSDLSSSQVVSGRYTTSYSDNTEHDQNNRRGPGPPISSTPHETGLIHKADRKSKNRISGCLRREKKLILLGTASFFMFSGMYCFEAFAVNFLGEGVFGGDPHADVDSEEYKNYLNGIQAGSLGTLTYYISFAVVNPFQEFLLDKLGWKLEMILVGVVYVVLSLLCALTSTLWSFYLCAVWTGVYRTVVMSVPYILANMFAREQDGGKAKVSGFAMARVSAMLPLGFCVCSALIGPLTDFTGDPAMPIYYTAVTSFLGTVVVCFLPHK